MKSYELLGLGALLSLAIACTPEDDTPGICTTPPPPPNYYPLAVGNYWIYDWFRVNKANNEDESYVGRDTLYITGLETINGQEYFHFEYLSPVSKPTVNEFYHRDSAGMIVNSYGKVYFADQQLGELIESSDIGDPPFAVLEIFVGEKDSTITVPAGNFTSVQKEGRLTYTNPDHSTKNESWYDQFTAGIGEVKGMRSFFGSGNYFEFRLVDYHLE